MSRYRLALIVAALTPALATADPLTMTARHRVAGPAVVEVRHKPLSWEPKETAIIICDMWDKHWCNCATQRVGEMAPKMNALIATARERGVFIIHCPSDCMDFYNDTPQRKRAMTAPVAKNQPKDIGGTCRRLDNEPALPIDDSDGGCDDVPAAKNFKAWTRQHEAIKIADADAITDTGREVWNLLQDRGIKHVVMMGVHTNMCVVGRSFGLRQLTKNGVEVVLARDLTDAMYNPQKSPFVSHRRGTQMVIEHIEQHIAPSIHSADLCGDAPKLHVVFVVGEDEYRTEVTLPEFAKKELEPRGIRCTFVHADAQHKNSFPGIVQLKDADLMLLSVRRRVPPPEQLAVVREYLDSGRPMVGIRTSSHAFALRDKPEGWPGLDKEVLGGDYQGHYDNSPEKGPATVCTAIGTASRHPILSGVSAEVLSKGTLYKNKTLAKSAIPLLVGRIGPDGKENEYVAWTNVYKGGRVFYTSLGYEEDFKGEAFRRLLVNGVFWALDQPISSK